MSVKENNSGTEYKIVIPFYCYAAVSFLASTVLLFYTSTSFTGHYFSPPILAITHTMALGWGTMIILGASYQLIPVLVEAELYSKVLAFISFIFAAVGIPMLIHSFYAFQFGFIAKHGAILINLAVLLYLVNGFVTATRSKATNMSMLFVLTAGLWLFATTIIGLLLIWNFTVPLLDKDSLHYLSLHAHIGIIGWFVMMVVGVSSRLLPMFLLSEHEDNRRLALLYGLINGSLVLFILLFYFSYAKIYYLAPLAGIAVSIILFFQYARKIYATRIRRSIDMQTKLSLLSVIMLAIPILVLAIALMYESSRINAITIGYGFTIFFGWLTAIILGMTFKTLPFIIWSRFYGSASWTGEMPQPKDLFSHWLFKLMAATYLIGFIIFTCGIFSHSIRMLQSGSGLLMMASIMYTTNVLKIIRHKVSKCT